MQTAFKIAAADAMPLDAILFTPDDGPLKAAVMFNAGTAIPKEFYQRFVQHLAEHGYAVVLYDYRGVGGSRPASLRGFEAYLRDWGELDMVGMLEWLDKRYPVLPKFIVAHSMGGQLVGLMRNHELASGIFMVASSIGYWRWMSGLLFQYFCAAIWFVYVPLASRLFGYVPIKVIRQGEDLPTGIAREWAAWCRRKNYLADFFGVTIKHPRYQDVRVPIRVIGLSDDNIANSRTVPAMMAYYKNASIDISYIAPAELKRKRIGHFGFFSVLHKDTLWQYALDWLDQRVRAVHDERAKFLEAS